MNNLRVILAQPRGFCAGVERAIEIVEKALQKFGPPVYVRHEIVHNKRVVESLKSKGAVFVEEVNEIPDGAVTVFSAHGVSQKVEDSASTRDLPILDATCPLVAKVHKEGQQYSKMGCEIILIGHEGHPEVEGTMGRIPGKLRRRMWVRENDLLIVVPWSFQDSKADVKFRYTPTQTANLKRRGKIPEILDIY